MIHSNDSHFTSLPAAQGQQADLMHPIPSRPMTIQWIQHRYDSDKSPPLEERAEGLPHTQNIPQPSIPANEDYRHLSAPFPSGIKVSDGSPAVSGPCSPDYRAFSSFDPGVSYPSRAEYLHLGSTQFDRMLQSIHGLREMLEKEGVFPTERDTMSIDLTRYCADVVEKCLEYMQGFQRALQRQRYMYQHGSGQLWCLFNMRPASPSREPFHPRGFQSVSDTKDIPSRNATVNPRDFPEECIECINNNFYGLRK